MIDVLQITTPLRQYVEVKWADAPELNLSIGMVEQAFKARYWTSHVGYFDDTAQFRTYLGLQVRQIGFKVMPELENEKWRKENRIHD